jgi:hypothetical protein
MGKSSFRPDLTTGPKPEQGPLIQTTDQYIKQLKERYGRKLAPEEINFYVDMTRMSGVARSFYIARKWRESRALAGAKPQPLVMMADQSLPQPVPADQALSRLIDEVQCQRGLGRTQRSRLRDRDDRSELAGNGAFPFDSLRMASRCSPANWGDRS